MYHQVIHNLNCSASYASVLTILSFSLERYLAICTPLYIFPMSDIKRAAIVSSLCWTIALLASVPHLVFTKYITKYIFFILKYPSTFLYINQQCFLNTEYSPCLMI